MKFEELSASRFSLRVKPRNVFDKLQPCDVLSIRLTRVRGEFEVRTEDSVVTVGTVVPVDSIALTDVLSVGRSVFAKMSDPAPDGSMLLEIVAFNGEILEMGDVEVGIDINDKCVQSLGQGTLESSIAFLREDCVFEHGGHEYFTLVAGGATDRYLTSTEGGRNFAIVGAGWSFALAEKDRGDGSAFFLANKFHRMRNRQEDSALRIAHGNLKFVDWTDAGGRALLAKAQLDRLVKREDSYFRKWDEFGNAEGADFLERARQVGVVRFTVELESKDDGGIAIVRCLNLTPDQKDGLEAAQEVDVVSSTCLPEYLNDRNMTFADFATKIARTDSAKKTRTGGLIKVKVKEFNAATGELCLRAELRDKDKDKPTGDCIILSVAGEVAQIKRRMNARLAIQNGRAANPNLGLLIEDGQKIPPSRTPPKMRPLTAAVRRKVFPTHPPTLAQERAIEIALNTPDIALIQGPPGTGKTTVIAAIIERLNEEFDKRGDLRGHVLLSGFQHDAVENMIDRDRLLVNGLPVPKFGNRPDEEDDAAFSRFEYQLHDWCAKKAEALRKKNPQIAGLLKDEQELRNLCVQYIQAPSHACAVSLIETALKLSDLTLGDALRKKLQMELRQLLSEESSPKEEKPLLRAVRSLRVSESGFADDGADRAADVAEMLKENDSDRVLLVQASHWCDEAPPPFLRELRALKARLLERFTPQPVFLREKSRDSVVELVRETIESIRLRGPCASDKRTAALSELLLEMENDPAGIQDAVMDYCFAFAATCQQSVNKTMQRIKGIDPDKSKTLDDEPEMKYDYVIVDEAARVGPRDLMIAMVQGKRIILVGDHRQLPHLIDEDVARKMEKDRDAADTGEWLEKSMFEHLFTKRVAQLEKDDGRRRHITLDAQFRMHPLLGEFISENFYERFDCDGHTEHFDSPLPESGFVHNLPGINGKCAVWIDVPRDAGLMDRVGTGTSWARSAEADVICEKLKAWIKFDDDIDDGENRKRLTFGVISFYKAQTELIKKKLGQRWVESVGEKRLRIGTVDAFQGREFDVVFLSLVRTADRGYGFLKVYNRLNVSMSRQKKLLVVVGDAASYETRKAMELVPGVAAFLKLCREKGEIL